MLGIKVKDKIPLPYVLSQQSGRGGGPGAAGVGEGPRAPNVPYCSNRGISFSNSFSNTFFLPSKASIFPHTTQCVFVAVIRP
jgi:hypothetical protein